MFQAADLDGEFFDFLSPFDDCDVSPEVGVSGGEVADTLMVAVVIVVIDEGADLAFQITRQEVVLQQDAVLQRLMPALDLALGLGVIGCDANMVYFPVFQPFSQIAGDIR